MIIGFDLAPTDKIDSGYCILSDSLEEVGELATNKDLTHLIEIHRPDVVVFSSPLSLPRDGNWRKAEDLLDKKNIKFVAPRGLLIAEKLVMRGMHLKEEFEKKGVLVIETHVGAFCSLLKILRKNNYLELKRLLKLYGLEIKRRGYTQDELDAIVSAFMGRLFLEAKVEFLGDEREGQIAIPNIRR